MYFQTLIHTFFDRRMIWKVKFHGFFGWLFVRSLLVVLCRGGVSNVDVDNEIQSSIMDGDASCGWDICLSPPAPIKGGGGGGVGDELYIFLHSIKPWIGLKLFASNTVKPRISVTPFIIKYRIQKMEFNMVLLNSKICEVILEWFKIFNRYVSLSSEPFDPYTLWQKIDLKAFSVDYYKLLSGFLWNGGRWVLNYWQIGSFFLFFNPPFC